MLPEWQQYIFFNFFQNFQALAKMLPEWQQNNFSNFSKIFKHLPECCENGNIMYFKIFERLIKCCHSGNILASAKNFKKFEKIKMLPFWQYSDKRLKILENCFVAILATCLQALKNSEKIWKNILLPFWQHFGQRLKMLGKFGLGGVEGGVPRGVVWGIVGESLITGVARATRGRGQYLGYSHVLP